MRLGIGTVQFGLNYGISSIEGKTSIEEVKKILHIAEINNIYTIDTAGSYGTSEEILGEIANPNFQIITKVHAPSDFNESLKKLNKEKIYGLLIHNPCELINKPEFRRSLEKFKASSKVEKIGVSVYSSEEIDLILNNHLIDIIQLPINVLDQRLIISGHLKKLKDKGIEIHARSIFLQGLLLMETDKIDSYFNPIKSLLDKYFDFLTINNHTKIEGAILFVKNIPEIDKIIIGVNNSKQLQENINAYNKKIKNLNFNNFCIDDTKYLNPSNWKLS